MFITKNNFVDKNVILQLKKHKEKEKVNNCVRISGSNSRTGNRFNSRALSSMRVSLEKNLTNKHWISAI